MMDETVFGIDLGTTFCACASAVLGELDIDDIRLDGQDWNSLPSVVFLAPSEMDGRRAYVGRRAISERVEGRPGELVQFAKRFIGKKGDDAASWSFDGETLNPVDISALILTKIVKQIRDLGDGVDTIRAVVTHPRDFTLPRREATEEAVRLAGIELIDTLNEPEAAAYAYFEPRRGPDPGTYMVFDLGGGSLDIALLEVPEEGRVKVIGGAAVAELGGKDWDIKMFEEILASAEAFHARDAFSYSREATSQTIQTIRDLAVEWKKKASQGRANRSLKKHITTYLEDGNSVPTIVNVQVSEWEEKCEPLVAQCADAIDRALRDASCRDEDIVRVLPVGGSVRLRGIQRLLSERFGERARAVDKHGFSVDLAVARGAARCANFLMCQRKQERGDTDVSRASVEVMLDDAPVSTLSHGINVLARDTKENRDFLAELVGAGAELPCHRQQPFRVVDPGAALSIEVFEGPPGRLLEGTEPSVVLLFEHFVKAKAGDAVTVLVDVAASGRIEVSARHEDSGEVVQRIINKGAGGNDEGSSESRPGDAFRARKTLLESITVI